jgi:cell division protein FtsB
MAANRFLDPSSVPLRRQSGGNIWATLVPIIQGAIVVGLLAVVGLFFIPVIHTQNMYKAELAKLHADIAAAEDHQAELRLETEYMKNSPSYVEHIARDELNMGKPGETIIRFDRYQPSASPTKIQSTDSDDAPSN